MTTVYFVRHAESDHQNRDERTRGLSPRGMRDKEHVTRFLTDKGVDVAFSSPYQRAIDTIADFTGRQELKIHCEEDFREWRRDARGFESFEEMCRRCWTEFDFKAPDSESLREVQERNIGALEKILECFQGKTVIIGTHGMALSTVLNYYDANFGYEDFKRLLPLMPLIVKLTFDGKRCLTIEQISFSS